MLPLMFVKDAHLVCGGEVQEKDGHGVGVLVPQKFPSER